MTCFSFSRTRGVQDILDSGRGCPNRISTSFVEIIPLSSYKFCRSVGFVESEQVRYFKAFLLHEFIRFFFMINNFEKRSQIVRNQKWQKILPPEPCLELNQSQVLFVPSSHQTPRVVLERPDCIWPDCLFNQRRQTNRSLSFALRSVATNRRKSSIGFWNICCYYRYNYFQYSRKCFIVTTSVGRILKTFKI